MNEDPNFTGEPRFKQGDRVVYMLNSEPKFCGTVTQVNEHQGTTESNHYYTYHILFDHGMDAKWVNEEYIDHAYALGKQEEETDTVIQGWVCRDKKDNALYLHVEKPYRAQGGCDVWDDPDWWESGWWESDCPYLLPLDKSLFPNLTWDSDPIEVEIIIKRKK